MKVGASTSWNPQGLSRNCLDYTLVGVIGSLTPSKVTMVTTVFLFIIGTRCGWGYAVAQLVEALHYK
jgi:hypothetical protein